MTQQYAAGATHPAALAARTILACPAEVELAVDGVPHPLADDARLVFEDWSGTPSFLCLPGGTLARAGADERHVLLAVTGAMDRAEAVTLAGRLRLGDAEFCPCCDDTRLRIVVDLTHVVLGRSDGDRAAVPLEEFANPALQLNPGFLHSTTAHANRAHHDELRHAVAQRTGRPARDVVAAQLSRLGARSVEVQWVTAEGAHRTVLRFPATARDARELAEMLRRALHPGLC